MTNVIKKARARKNMSMKCDRCKETISQKWIDVQDKLPEEYKSVLGVANGVDVRIVHYAFGGFWIEDTTGEEYNITYWMPLPEIPKEN